MNRVKGIIFLIIFGVLCILVITQASIESKKMIIPNNRKNEVTWDVVFKADQEINEIIVDYTDGVEFTMPQLFDTIVNDFDVSFKKPEEKISYKFNIVNNSEYDAYILHYNKPKIECIDNNDLCISNLDKIEYKFIYEDGEEVKLNDIIKAKESKKVIIKIKYKSNKEEIPMNITKLGFSLTFATIK